MIDFSPLGRRACERVTPAISIAHRCPHFLADRKALTRGTSSAGETVVAAFAVYWAHTSLRGNHKAMNMTEVIHGFVEPLGLHGAEVELLPTTMLVVRPGDAGVTYRLSRVGLEP